MAFDEGLAQRVRAALQCVENVTEKRQFGCLGFHVRGNMACVVVGERLMVRVGSLQHEAVLKRQHVVPMDFAGRSARGMVYVLPAGLRRRSQLEGWLRMGVDFALSLKEKPTRRTSSRRGAPARAR